MMLLYALHAQAASMPIQPFDRWVLASQDFGCQVSRPYSADGTIQLGIEAPLNSTPILLLAAPNKWLPSGIGETRVIVDEGDPIDLHFGTFPLAVPGIRLIKLFPDANDWQRLAHTKSLALGPRMPPLALSGVVAAQKAVGDCAANLLASWGGNPELYRRGKLATVTGKFAAAFNRDTYPREALARKITGRIILLLTTLADGSVSECRVVSSANVALDEETCRIAQRQRLNAPVNDQGQPMASIAAVKVDWIMY